MLPRDGILQVQRRVHCYCNLVPTPLFFFFFADDEPNCAQVNSGGLSPGAIVGISIGCIINVAVVVAALYWVRIS